MAATWPASLPVPSPSGYKVTPGDGRQISNMSQGPVRIRRIYETVHDIVDLQLELNGNEIDDWNNLWDVTLQGGVLPVNMPLLIGSSVVNTDVLILSRSHPLRDNRFFTVSIKVQVQ